MSRLRSRLAAALACGAIFSALIPVAADAYVVPNLAVVASPDLQVAIAYADNRTPQAIRQAGAFTTDMQAYGFVGVPNYDPVSVSGSTLVCEMPLNPSGLWVVYGIEGAGVNEAIGFCQYMASDGMYVRWRLNN
jgi:hypothetical protein